MPIYVFAIIALSVGMFVWSRMRLRAGMAAAAGMELGALATRLGLQVVEGDPKINLYYFQQPSRDYTRTIRLKGQAEGLEVTFTIVDGKETSDYLVYRKIVDRFGSALDAVCPGELPAFEVVLRKPNEYLVASPELNDRNLPRVSTGDASLDATYEVRAADPGMGPLLVPALQAFSGQLYVHLASDGRRVWCSFTRYGLPSFANAPEAYLRAVVLAARAGQGSRG